MAPREAERGGLEPIVWVDRRFLAWLTVLALITRLVWVLWVHPPWDFVFSDMAKYVERAQAIVEHGFVPARHMAWQAWGTHVVLAAPLSIFGAKALWSAAVLWGLCAAAAVPLGYLLAARVATRTWIPKATGVALLLWHPNLSNAGYFLSEAPFLLFQLWSTYRLVVVIQEGRGAFGAGVISAIAFALRPQSAMFYVLVLVTWWLARRRLPHVRARQLLGVALPLVLMLGFSFWRFHAHTGYWAGVAENANMNLTAGRCHNIVTQAFPNQHALRNSEAHDNTKDGRRVSLPGFRSLAKWVPDDHPLGLRPAMGSETIRFVGYVGDPDVHREIRRQCWERTGLVEQIRYGLVNVMLQWAVTNQWPEMERGRQWFLPPVIVFKYVFLVLVLVPSLLGIVLSLWWLRRRPGLALCGWQLVTSMVIAAIFFGDIRLRSPYDPYALLLALEVWARVFERVRRR